MPNLVCTKIAKQEKNLIALEAVEWVALQIDVALIIGPEKTGIVSG